MLGPAIIVLIIRASCETNERAIVVLLRVEVQKFGQLHYIHTKDTISLYFINKTLKTYYINNVHHLT